MLSRILILLLLSSCSLFKGSEKLSNPDILKNIEAVKVEGEGKGRLHIRERQYLFGIEAVLKDDKSWILAVTIPLHGEEALIFPDLREKDGDDSELDSFARRIDSGIRENLKDSNLKGKDFLQALRKTLRVLLAHKLGLPLKCQESFCSLDDDVFQIEKKEKEISVITSFAGHNLIATASNLTGPFFMNTRFKVLSPEGKRDLITLELFWK
jgi:hypothetical protein